MKVYLKEQLPSSDVNLFYNEKNSPPLVITVKFCPDIYPRESGLFRDKIRKVWTVEMSAIKSFFRLFLKKSCVNFHAVWVIPTQYSRWAAERGIRNYYGGFVCYVLKSYVFECSFFFGLFSEHIIIITRYVFSE